MDVGSWIKQNKLAASAIAGGGALIYLSKKGASGGGADGAVGQLVPVAAGYPNEDTSPFEEAASAAQSAAEAADQATQAAQTVVDNNTTPAADVPVADAPTAVVVPPTAAFAATPAPSSLTPPPAPVAPTTIQKYSLPGGYTPGTVLGYGAGTPGNLHILIGNVLGYKMVGSGSNSNGSFNTIRFYSDIGATAEWNIYYSGPKQREWVGPFNVGQRPGG